MKFVSWNVNGLRAVVKKGFYEFVKDIDPDILAIQETKMQPDQLDLNLDNYYIYYNSAIKKGYAGTAVLTKSKPLNIIYDILDEQQPLEGRVITLEFDEYYFVNAYVPNSKEGLKRLDYRVIWEGLMLNHLVNLNKHKPVIYCGDLNVAHNEIDLKNPKNNHKNPGFTNEERNCFSTLLDNNFIDVFRHLYPNKIQYSWWSYRFNARLKGIGWRIDYFICSKDLIQRVNDCIILDDIYGSDHCPVLIDIK